MKIRGALRIILLVGLIIWTASSAPAASATRRVVLLFDERPELPGMAMLEAEFVRTLTSVSADHIEIYREAMDLSRFGSDTYPLALRDFLRAKYAGKKIDVAVGVIGPALEFATRRRGFPGGLIVFCGIDRRLQPLFAPQVRASAKRVRTHLGRSTQAASSDNAGRRRRRQFRFR